MHAESVLDEQSQWPSSRKQVVRQGGQKREGIDGELETHIHSSDEQIVEGCIDHQIDALLAAIPYLVDLDVALGDLKTSGDLLRWSAHLKVPVCFY